MTRKVFNKLKFRGQIAFFLFSRDASDLKYTTTGRRQQRASFIVRRRAPDEKVPEASKEQEQQEQEQEQEWRRRSKIFRTTIWKQP